MPCVLTGSCAHRQCQTCDWEKHAPAHHTHTLNFYFIQVDHMSFRKETTRSQQRSKFPSRFIADIANRFFHAESSVKMYIEDFESFANGIRSRQYSNRFLSGIELSLIGSTPFVEAFLALFRRLNERTILDIFLVLSVRVQVVCEDRFDKLEHPYCSRGISEE